MQIIHLSIREIKQYVAVKSIRLSESDASILLSAGSISCVSYEVKYRLRHCLFQLLDMREGNKSACLVSQVFAESWRDLFCDQAYGKDCRNQGKGLSTLKAAQTKNE